MNIENNISPVKQSNQKEWLITDTHWNHANIIKYENRPLNFNELIIENWSKMVKPEDRIYHLGDVIFKKQGTLRLILERCPGDKILCKGNHDHNADAWYIRKGFSSVVSYYITNGILLSHSPLDIEKIEKETGEKIKYNIHGHFHRKNRNEIDRGPNGYPFYSDRHLLLAIEEENYKPILIEDFIKKKIL